MDYQPTKLQNAVTIDELFTIHYFEYYRDYNFAGESHNFWEFLYIDKGEIDATCRGELMPLHTGQAVLYRPCEFHALRANGVSAPNTVVISFSSDCPELFRLTGAPLALSGALQPVIADILTEARTAFVTDLGDPCYTRLEIQDNCPYGSLQLIRIGIERLLIQLLRSMDAPPVQVHLKAMNKQNEEHILLHQAEMYIEQHISEPLSMESIAAACGTSVSPLNRIFNKYTGSGIIGYLRRKRIRTACQLIRESDCNFTQIAEKLGFCIFRHPRASKTDEDEHQNRIN